MMDRLKIDLRVRDWFVRPFLYRMLGGGMREVLDPTL